MSVYIQTELFEKIEEYCQAYGISKSDFVRFAIRNALEGLGLIEAVSSPKSLMPIKTEGR